MGGTACWSVARFAKERLAVVAPVVGRVFEPKVLSEARAGTGSTCLVISGEVDAKSEPGSAEMVKATWQGRGCGVCDGAERGSLPLAVVYHEKQFYEWLLSHKQGQPKPAGRLGEPAIIAMVQRRSSYNTRYLTKMEKDLQDLAAWWSRLTTTICSAGLSAEMKKEVFGKQGVLSRLAAHHYEIPCRLIHHDDLPKAEKVTLHLVVGRHPEGDWRLVVRVNEQEVFASPIDKTTARICGRRLMLT